jgi:hypothetical protein
MLLSENEAIPWNYFRYMGIHSTCMWEGCPWLKKVSLLLAVWSCGSCILRKHMHFNTLSGIQLLCMCARYRYSVFVSASLLITFITLSGTLLRALHKVRDLAACTEPNSRCFHDVQRWFHKLLFQGLLPVDIETLEAQFSAVCHDPIAPQIRDTLPASEFTAEVRPRKAQHALLTWAGELLHAWTSQYTPTASHERGIIPVIYVLCMTCCSVLVVQLYAMRPFVPLLTTFRG